MAFFEWQDDFSVHVREIDQQHKKLIVMINDIHLNLFKYARLDLQSKVVNAMIEYAADHFQTEEKYMAEFNYPLSIEHMAEHDKFRKKTKELKLKMQKQGYVMSMELLSYLKIWWKKHILITDMKYSEFFNEHGLK
ncbi:MAG: bacteriohemerythrin [Candidatus Omnitrophota bacterium]